MIHTNFDYRNLFSCKMCFLQTIILASYNSQKMVENLTNFKYLVEFKHHNKFNHPTKFEHLIKFRHLPDFKYLITFKY